MALNEAQKRERSEYLERNLVITECSQGQPYIFVSYASDNWERVFKTAIVPLQKQYGLRVYADKAFDKEIDKWIVPMLRNIRGADMVVAFISQSYIESYACFLELLTAVNNKKQIVFVSLEEQLHLGDATNLPAVERGVKSEILNQGANIATNTTNTSNAVMRAMKSAYSGLNILLKQDAMSKYDITNAFINFIRDAAIKQQTVNDLRAVKWSIGSVSRNVFDQSLVSEVGYEAESVALVRKPASVDQPGFGNGKEGFAGKLKDFRRQSGRFKAGVIGGVAVLLIAIIIVAVALGGSSRNVTDKVYAISDDTIGIYTGEWQDGKPNGQGRMGFDDGSVYEGEWKDGRMNGQGAFTFANGDVQEGEWKDGEANGHGKIIYTDGDVFEGEYKDDKLNGHGILICENGDVFEGEYKDDKLNGYGMFKYANGNVFEGEFKDDKPNGHGILAFANGEIFEGEFKDGQLNGEVTYTDADGNVTAGIWKDGEMVAKKVTDQAYTISSGRAGTYTGEWWDDKPNGQGRMEFESGVYDGQWEDGKMNGQGRLTWTNDGVVYEGEFEDNQLNGYGTFTWTNGDVYEGEFKDGKRNGQGRFTWADGDVYEGEWKNGRQNGYGTYAWADGNVYEGEWKDGKLNGQGRVASSDGDVYEGEFKDGKRNGEFTHTDADGNVTVEIWENDEKVQ